MPHASNSAAEERERKETRVREGIGEISEKATQKSVEILGQKEELGKNIESAAEERERKETRVRDFVTRCFAGLFIIIVFVAVMLPILSHYFPPSEGSNHVFEQIQSILQGPVLSVLNLVLGYYFGRAASH